MKIKLFVDSTCDLPLEILKEHNVGIIPLYVNFNEEQYLDIFEIDTLKLYQLVDEKKKLPKTAARGVGEFAKEFQKAFDDGYEQVMYLGISSFFSSSVNNAILASKEFNGKVFVHDTYNLSSGEGLLILEAIRMVEEGMDAKDILSSLNEIRNRVRSQFAVESLEYLYRGGRCSQTSYFIGQGFRIKPIIKVVDGKMIVYRKPIGKMVNALNKLLDIFKEDFDKDNVELGTVMITHSLADESYKYLYKELSKLIPKENILETKAGCVISSHCGKGTIGILYITKK